MSNTEWVEQVLEREVGVGKFQYIMLMICGGTQFSDAMELILLPLLAGALSIEEPEHSPMHLESTWMLSFCVFAGMLIGAPSWGWVADNYGRRNGTFGTSLLVGVAGFASSLVSSHLQLYVARFFVGCGLGGASCALAWFSEVLPRSRRESWLIWFFLFFSIGSVACAGLAWATLVGAQSWRMFLQLACLPSLCVATLTWCLPESPVFLATRNRKMQARTVLSQMTSMNKSSPKSPHEQHYEDLELLHVDETDTVAEPPRLYLPQTTSLKAVSALCSLFAIMAVVYYALVELSLVYLWPESSGRLQNNTYLQILIVNAAELPGLFAALGCVRKLGSRSSVAIMFASCAFFCLVMSTLAVSKDQVDTRIATALLFGARASALGFNQSLWIYSSSFFASQHRAFGVGVVTAFARIGGLLSPFIGQLLFAQSQSVALFICAFLCMVAGVGTHFALPQVTRGQIAVSREANLS